VGAVADAMGYFSVVKEGEGILVETAFFAGTDKKGDQPGGHETLQVEEVIVLNLPEPPDHPDNVPPFPRAFVQNKQAVDTGVIPQQVLVPLSQQKIDLCPGVTVPELFYHCRGQDHIPDEGSLDD
jgi:hypothetical protein